MRCSCMNEKAASYGRKQPGEPGAIVNGACSVQREVGSITIAYAKASSAHSNFICGLRHDHAQGDLWVLNVSSN